MKKVFRPFSLVLSLLFLTQLSLRAQNDHDNDNDNDNKDKKYEFVKKKSVNKSYNVSSSDKLNIENSFGKVEIHVWEKNEIKVDVDVEVSANTEAAAQKIFDRISNISNMLTPEESDFFITSLKQNIISVILEQEI